MGQLDEVPKGPASAPSARKGRPGRLTRCRGRGAALNSWPLAVLLLLAVLHTWPLVTDPGRLSGHNDDEWLNAWVVSWIAHQLPRDPFALFDANMYWPTEKALAYTEPLIVPALMGAPLRWLGASAMMTHNLLVLLGLTLTALAMYRLVVAWTGDSWAGILAGAVLAFSCPLLTRLGHLQVLHLYSLPLAFLAFDRLVRYATARDAVWLGLWVLCAALTSGYLVVFVTATLGGALLARTPELWNRRGLGVVARLIAAAVATLAVGLGLLAPYLEAQRPRPLSVDAPDLGTALSSYVTSSARLHYESWSSGLFQETLGRDPLFPGVVALALAALGFAARGVAPGRVRPMLLVVVGLGGLLSLGPLTPVFGWAYEFIPPIQSLRAHSRFGILVVFAVAALAGLGLAALRARSALPSRTVLTIGLLAAATVESIHGPARYQPVAYEPPIHRALRAVEPGPIVEFPFHFRGGRNHLNAWYLLASTAHWRPMVAGFGNFRPPGYDDLAQIVSTFPSVLATARLWALDVDYAVVHTARHRRPRRILTTLEQARSRSDIGLAAEVGSDRLYRIRAAPDTGGLADLEWSGLRFVREGEAGSYLRAIHAAGRGFGLQGPDRFVAYVQNPDRNAELTMRLPVGMSGRFVDAFTGRDLGPVTVAAASSRPPSRVSIPGGRSAVIVSLRAF